jgi:hypothetical protein
MCFILDCENRDKRVATKDIPVFKRLKDGLKSKTMGYSYRVDASNPEVCLRKLKNTINEGYHSWRAPEPGYYRFVIPKGSRYYYTTNESLQYVSSNIRLVSDKPLTEEECVEICNFPKTYREACERLGIKPMDEGKFIQYGLDSADIAYKKLETVFECINRQYGIEKYDWENCSQAKWYGFFYMDSPFRFYNVGCKVLDVAATSYVEAGRSYRLHLPFQCAVDYVCYINTEFFEYWKSYIL